MFVVTIQQEVSRSLQGPLIGYGATYTEDARERSAQLTLPTAKVGLGENEAEYIRDNIHIY